MTSEHLPAACLSLAWCLLAAVVAFSSLIYCITMTIAQIAVIVHPNKQLVNIKERMSGIGALVFYLSLMVCFSRLQYIFLISYF